MKNLNTITDEWNSIWTLTSLDLPIIEINPPYSFHDYCCFPSINYLDNETHKILLNESLNIYDKIWVALAKK